MSPSRIVSLQPRSGKECETAPNCAAPRLNPRQRRVWRRRDSPCPRAESVDRCNDPGSRIAASLPRHATALSAMSGSSGRAGAGKRFGHGPPPLIGRLETQKRRPSDNDRQRRGGAATFPPMDIENDQCEKPLRMSTGANARGSMRHRKGARRCGWRIIRKAGTDALRSWRLRLCEVYRRLNWPTGPPSISHRRPFAFLSI